MYPYNTDSVKVSLSEYPHYVKELYNQPITSGFLMQRYESLHK